MANREREDNIYYARLAEQGERYEDMIRYMKEVARVSPSQWSRTPRGLSTLAALGSEGLRFADNLKRRSCGDN